MEQVEQYDFVTGFVKKLSTYLLLMIRKPGKGGGIRYRLRTDYSGCSLLNGFVKTDMERRNVISNLSG